jgi:hypothetical protein
MRLGDCNAPEQQRRLFPLTLIDEYEPEKSDHGREYSGEHRGAQLIVHPSVLPGRTPRGNSLGRPLFRRRAYACRHAVDVLLPPRVPPDGVRGHRREWWRLKFRFRWSSVELPPTAGVLD